MYFIAFVLVLLLSDFGLCYNFDTDFPIVYSSASQNGLRQNYFGYSVILYPGDRSWVQIGAPRSNDSNKLFFEPGAVYRCGIYGPCYQLPITTDQPISNGFFREKRDGAWLGGAMDVDVTNGRLAVCSHRWIYHNMVKKDYLIQGACYWSYAKDNSSQSLYPLSDEFKAIYTDSSSRASVYYYGQGQAGTSVHFPNTMNLDSPNLVIGAPGVYNWDGTSILYKDADTDFSNLNVANTMFTPETSAFSLFGYSTASGRFFNRNELLFVTGAPRSKHCMGQVLVYKFRDFNDRPLDVKDTKVGVQLGEYFGASLTAGDINNDGLDDLIVGSPFYTSSKYNEGKITVFLGSSLAMLRQPESNAMIEGKAIGGQFGMCVTIIGDVDLDGFIDLAVGAPYENSGSGVVYIFRGGARGLDSEPSQRIIGQEAVPGIKGFGISISKAADVDLNYYQDILVGAYLSSQAALFRGKPIVTLQHSIKSLSPRLDHNAGIFTINVCSWFSGQFSPLSINISREITIDEVFHRAILPAHISNKDLIILKRQEMLCENLTMFLRPNITNHNDPITITISQELLEEKFNRSPIFVGNSNANYDYFCKSCPVYNKYKSMKRQKLEIPFALGCGSDNVCTTVLKLKSSFSTISKKNEFVIGSSDYLIWALTLSNEGEKAYLTQIIVALPNFVNFRSIAENCVETNTTQILLCNVDNPLDENKQKTIEFDLDMKEVGNKRSGDHLDFQVTVLTASENKENNTFVLTLTLTREADMVVVGETSKQSYSYENITYGKPNFTQRYQVQKLGASPIEEVVLTVQLPVSINSESLVNFVRIYPPEGYLGGQPINCRSDIQYIMEDDRIYTGSGLSENSLSGNETSVSNEEENEVRLPVKRSVDGDQMLPEKGYLFGIYETESESELPTNRTFYINCTNSNFLCSNITCFLGPFRNRQNSAVLQIKMQLELSLLQNYLGEKDIIVFSTIGSIEIKNPVNFIQSGNGSDIAIVSSTFLGESIEFNVALWILIAAVVAGFLLLLILIIILTKAGFFKRKAKIELQALKDAEVKIYFMQLVIL